jgi:hypothetical protein
MGNISTKIDLQKLIHQKKMVKGAGGKDVECLIIPIEANNLYAGTKGTYLDLIGFELNNPTGKDTHLVKQSLSEEVRKGMSKDELEQMPILGNHIDWDSGSSSSKKSEPATKSKAKSRASDDDEPPF